MDELEFDFVDKTGWAPGPWHNEPDKRQWRDAATGYLCMVIRNGTTGSLCGYTGVKPAHPAYGLSTEGIPALIADIMQAQFRDDIRAWGKAGHPPLEEWAKQRPPMERPNAETAAGQAVYAIEVHGGLTWASESHPVTDADWRDFVKGFPAARRSAAQFPQGDAARFLKEYEGCETDYEKWKTTVLQRMIVSPTEPDLWWFGFDCGHAWDVQPGMDALLSRMRGPRLRAPEALYRTIGYVETHCAVLAKQLKDIEVNHARKNVTEDRDNG